MKPNHKDKRGTITDLLVGKNFSVTHITFKKGVVRGNHLHNKTNQIDIVISGKLLCVIDNYEGRYHKKLSKGKVVEHPAKVAHAYKALEDSEIVSICIGKRVGENYEKDTFRLKEPLI
jgi:quercetin dioxygenase-like cupin family protein